MLRRMKRWTAAVLAAVMMTTTMPLAFADSELTEDELPNTENECKMTDIENHWGRPYIERALENNWFRGMSETEFNPNGKMTRGMFVTALASYSGEQIDTSNGTTHFTDVNPKAYYAPYVKWANEKGIVRGMTDTTFCPNTPISRQQIAVMIVNYVNANKTILPRIREWNQFADTAQCADYALDAIYTLYRAEILNGRGENRFDPKATASRAECVTIFCNLNDACSEQIAPEQRITLINHRGYNMEAGENTMAAYELAAKYGYKYVETDIFFTKDNVPILLHDPTIDRTSNGQGKVSEMTYEQLKQYDYSNGHAGVDGSLATFEEFMQFCAENDIRPLAELKNSASEAQVKKVTDIAAKYGMLEKTVWSSFWGTSLQNVRKVCPTATLGYVVSEITSDKLKVARSLRNGQNTVTVHVAYNRLTTAGIASLIREDFPMIVWTVNSMSGCVKYANSSAVCITTDSFKEEWLYS